MLFEAGSDKVAPMKLSEILQNVPNILKQTNASTDPEITAPVVEDSRQVEPGGIFLARKGGSVDGHHYIQAAIDRGAAAIVGERSPDQVACSIPYIQVADGGLALAYLSAAYHDFPAQKLVMIGITGTDGKTTTATLLYSILKAAGIRAGMISTINAEIGDESVATGLHVTTPPSPEVQGYLKRMVEAGLTHCVMETTSHGWAQHRVAACDFDLAVITNIQHEHLDFHKTWENYRDAKAMLFRDLMQSTRKPGIPKLAVINLNDTPSAGYLLDIPADRHLRYAIGSEFPGDVLAVDTTYAPDSTRIMLQFPDRESLELQAALVGTFNVSNILAAVSAAYGLNIPNESIKAGIEAVKAIPGRLERIDEGQDFLALVDFAHTPNALRRALEAARLMTGGRVIAIFGSAGLRDPEKRAMMGTIAGELADLVVITAEDPRTESLEEIMAISAAACTEAGKVEGETFWRIADRGEALHFATQLAQSGDVVIACGKGHEQSMCFGTVEYPWDDREAMRAALKGQPLLTLPTAG